MPGSQTRTKLKAFQFIEGKPNIAVAEDADKENEVDNDDSPRNPHETPVKRTNHTGALATSKALPPSTPATRLPLADLIGNPDNKRVAVSAITPEEHVLWLHAQTPSSSHPTITPARKRKRARSSSPATSSQNEPPSFFPENKETFDVQGLQRSLKTPQADPAADLWNRYHASADDGSTATKSVAFAHLIKNSSPRSSETAGSVSGLRRWASCGVEWPTSATKRRRIYVRPKDEEQKPQEDDLNGGELPKMSKVGLLLERMKETLQKPPERNHGGPASSSPLPERGYMDEEAESPLERLAPVMEEGQQDGGLEAEQFAPAPPKSIRKSQRSSSEFGDDDIDTDMLEALECTMTEIQSQAPKLEIQNIYATINAQQPMGVAQQQEPPDPLGDTRHTLQQQANDEFGDDDDDLFTADMEQMACKYDSQAVHVVLDDFKLEDKASAIGAVRSNPVVLPSDDEFGDDDFDEEELVAAEVAATQAFQGSMDAFASVCSRTLQL
jgi:DNA replication ATP-dependent helicase Dna2